MPKTSKGIPLQSVPLSKKSTKWRKEVVRTIIDMSEFADEGSGFNSSYSDVVPFKNSWVGHRRLKAKMYMMYNGIIDNADYSHVLKPYGNRNQKDRKFPARLHNYNVIGPFVDLLCGEYAKRPLVPIVNVLNDDVINIRDLQLQQQLRENLMQHFLNELAAIGYPVPTDATGEAQLPNELVENFNLSYRDQRGEIGMHALEFWMDHQDVRDKLEDGFFHWLISGEVFSKTDVYNGELTFEILNPLDVDYDKSPDTKFVEDAEWVVYRALMYPSDIINHFYEQLTDEQVKRIERADGNNSSFSRTSQSDLEGFSDERFDSSGTLQSVFFVYWKGKSRIGIAKGTDPDTGMSYEFEVEDGYTKNPGESVEWLWINEAWGGVRVGRDIYLDIEPLPIQRTSLSNRATCKLPINGRRYSDINSPNVSFAMKLAPYQLIYNIYKFRLNNAVAKAKDMVAQLDINMIPKGWDVETWMYYVDAFGISWTDYAKEGIVLNPTHQTVLDLTAKSINSYIDLLSFTVQEMQEITGISRQRKGQFSQFDLKGVSEQAVVQSSHITERLFNDYRKFEESVLQSILDYSKIAWIEGHSGAYVMPDGTIQYLAVDGLQHAETEYGIRVRVNSEELRALNEMKQLALPLIQNGAPAELVIDLFDAKSFAGLKKRMKEADAAAQQAAQAAQEAQLAIEEAKNQQALAELEQKRDANELDNQTKVLVAEMQLEAQARNIDLDANDNGIRDANEMLMKRDLSDKEERLKRAELRQKDSIQRAQLALEKEKHEDKMVIERKKLRKQTTTSK